jgi:two-component system response regulator HydG
MKTNVLVVDAELAAREFCAEVLSDMGFQTHAAESAAGARAFLERERVGIVLADARMPGLTCPELLKVVKQGHPGTEVVIVTGPGAVREAAHAMALGAADFLARPFQADDLRQVMQRLAEKQSLRVLTRWAAEPAPGGEAFQGLIAASAKMREIQRLILKVAPRRCPVLILGESGTGKELVARALHAHGPWHQQPFVPVDCGALTPTLIESELFGHVRGAFTGANQNRQGLLATAGEGTVLLDEVGELPLELQAKLLRCLQEKEFRPVGSNVRVRLAARIVVATNQDLQAAVARGTFRKELYYRLNVVTIRIPPLRARKEDIPALVQHFMARYREGESDIAGMSDEAMGRLLQYPWPGNVRELENCIQRALAVSAGPLIQEGELSSNVLNYRGEASKAEEVATLRRMERQAILQALETTEGDRARAARLLGIGKSTIYRKLKEYGIEDKSDSSSSPQ